MTTTRRLAAILAADVAGYSRFMGADEVEALKSHRCEVIVRVRTENAGPVLERATQQ
jgi:adenylate cyclase